MQKSHNDSSPLPGVRVRSRRPAGRARAAARAAAAPLRALQRLGVQGGAGHARRRRE